MDAMDFIRVSVSSLGLRFNDAGEASSSSTSSSSYFCKIKLHDFPVQTAVIPVLNPNPNSNPNPTSNANPNPNPSSQSTSIPSPNPKPNPNLIHQTSRTNSSTYLRNGGAGEDQPYFSNGIRASFYLDKPTLNKLLLHNLHCFGAYTPSISPPSPLLVYLEILVFSGLPTKAKSRSREQGQCKARQIGSFKIRVCPEWSEGRVRPLEVYHGWTSIDGKRKLDRSSSKAGSGVELHLLVRVEPDPRFLFSFDGDPALSSQIVQTLGSCRQPIFSCKFSRDRSSRSGLEDAFKGWSISTDRERDKEKKERKGWLVMIHDLSGSPIAAASMVTPFVPSAGSNHVSRSNPGAWLILRSDPGGVSSWCPWGRLEAWREQGLIHDRLGLRFQLVPEGGGININSSSIGDGILISEMVINIDKGGEFCIDTTTNCSSALSSPLGSPRSSSGHNFAFNMALCGLDGFIMRCSVGGKGGRSYHKTRMNTEVQVAVRHLSCVEDSAVFMALAAAVDLSIDACQSFTKKLRKELSD